MISLFVGVGWRIGGGGVHLRGCIIEQEGWRLEGWGDVESINLIIIIGAIHIDIHTRKLLDWI